MKELLFVILIYCDIVYCSKEMGISAVYLPENFLRVLYLLCSIFVSYCGVLNVEPVSLP